MICSFFLKPAESGIALLNFDTVIDGKHVFTGCGVGRVKDGDAELTHVGQATLMSLVEYAEDSQPGNAIRLQEIATVAAAPSRVRKALEAARDKDVVFFVCRDSSIYDAAVIALNVDWHAVKPPNSVS